MLKKLRWKLLDKWNTISEENRKELLSFLTSAINYLLNALLFGVPISIVTNLTYLQSVACVWFSLPVLEHYWIWFKEDWKDRKSK